MKDENKTKDQLIKELARIQEKNADLEEIIIEEKRTKKELKESEKKYKDLVEETPIGIANIGVTGKIIYINNRLEKISGYSREEIVGKNVFKLGVFPDEMLKILRERLKTRLKGGSVRRRREISFNCKNGKWIWIEITAKLIKKWGILSNFRITVQDITERKKAEEALRKSQQEFASIFHNNPEALVYLDNKDTVLEINSRFSELFGYNLKEVKGKDINSGIIHPPDKIEEAKRLTKKAIKGYINYDTIRKKKDGILFPVSVSGSPVLVDGKIKGRIILYQDITQRKQAEQKIKQGYEKLQRTMEATIYTISKIIETKDPYTAGHQNTVSHLAVAIAQKMKLPEDKVEGIRIASLIHDIGKIGLPPYSLPCFYRT